MKIVVFLLFALTLISCCHAEVIEYETVDGKLDSIKNSGAVIVIGDISCGLCLEKVNSIFKKNRTLRKINILVYIDSKLVAIYNRYLFLNKIQHQLKGFKYTVVFRPSRSPDLLSVQLKTCDITRSPYLILVNPDSISAICYEELFMDEISVKSIRQRLSKFYFEKKN